jgi:hypothetical protein
MPQLRTILTSPRSVSAFSLFSCIALSISASSLSAQALPSGGSLFRANVAALVGQPLNTYTAGAGTAPSAATGYTLVPGDSAVRAYNYTPGLPSEQFAGSVLTQVWQKNSTGQLAFTYVFDNIVPPIGTGGPTASDILGIQIEETSNAWHGIHILAAGADLTGGKSTAASGVVSWTDGTPLAMSFEQSSTTSGVAVDFGVVGLGGTQLRQPSVNNPDTSAIVWFLTDVTNPTKNVTTAQVNINDPVGTARVFAPVVPEPTTLVLALFGCLGGALMLWRRQSTN